MLKDIFRIMLDLLKDQTGAIGIYWNGRKWVRPQAMSRIDDTGMYARGLAGANTLAIIGEATGGEPKKVLWFTDPSYAKAIFRSGPLLAAIQRAYDPSAEVGGAYTVAAIRVNPATQSILALKDSLNNPLIFLTSVDYGIWDNQVKARVESPTTAGKKLTFTYQSAYDQGDNIYRKSFFLGLSDAMARSGTVSIAIKPISKLLTTSVVASSQKVYYDDNGTAVDQTVAAKDTGAPYFRTNIVTGQDCIYYGSDIMFNALEYAVGDVPNVVAAIMSGTYWDGTAWAALPNLIDGSSNAGAPFGKTGTISFYQTLGDSYTYPTNWVKNTPSIGATSLGNFYWIKLTTNGTLTGTASGDTLWAERKIKVNLSDYPYIQQLVDYLDSLPGYESGAITTKSDTEKSTELDDASATNLIGGGNTTLAGLYTSGRVLTVVATTSFAIGDYITVSKIDGSAEESRKITAVGSGSLTIDSALSTSYAIGSIVRESSILSSNLQAVIDWINAGNTTYVTAAYPAITWTAGKAYPVGYVVIPSVDNDHCYVANNTGTSDVTTEPTWPTTDGNTITDGTVVWTCRSLLRSTLTNMPDTYLTGGSEGATSYTDWEECLVTLQSEDTPLMTCVSYDPAVWASLSTHCDYMSSIGKKERRGFCGGFATADGYTSGLGKWLTTSQINASIDQMLSYAQELNSDRMYYVGPGFIAYDENGNKVTYNGAYAAALVAGMAAGVDVAEALTHKSIKALGLEYNLKWADLDRLLEGGVLPLEYDPGHGYRVCQSISTWLQSDKYNRRELSVGRTADYVARQVRDRLDADFVGRKGTTTTLISIKNAVISVLTQCVRLELLAGDAENPPFKNIQVRLEGDTAYVDFECSPCIPINFIPISIHLTIFTSTIVA